ncbi:TonB-dependent receptor [Flavobacterium sp. MAH-1]|uniref:TonB-dependent receptor n=1 Tax=Flavobacterium agri TaxID=2743471 RepID=A0A7Y8Y4K4_9FLAO|nr:TonB-dependent receptor [Flavobacterium agri]NUY82211.1 TonB-dependent receptor [Flavobacterium agri]NYA72235.1 TonB-dependent receptor [Flavobacterium agri]
MRNFIFCCLALLMLPAFANAQAIRGKVVDENGLPLPGVSINNTTSGGSTVTDIDGNFAVNAKTGDALKFSFIGYLEQTVAAAEGMSIKMAVSATALDEVVVVGYGTQRKADITGAIAVVNEKELRDRPNANPISSIQGKVAGVVVTNGGKPGEAPGIAIRGIGSIAGSTPLYVVDGVLTKDISYLNPNDVESMSLLKDASSSAIYGIRASNGVIVIKTKLGKKGEERIKLQYDTNVGFSTPTDVPDMANSADYVRLFNEKLAYEGNTNPDNQLNLADFNGVNTDWLDEVLKKQSFTQTHNLSISGGSAKAQYNLGLGYFTQEGILDAGKGISSGDDYKRISTRFNGLFHVTDKFRIGTNIAYSKSNSNDAANPIYRAIAAPPVIPVYNADGSYGHLDDPAIEAALGDAGNQNPRQTLDLFRGKSKGTRTLMSGYGEYDIIKGLTFKMSYSRDVSDVFSYTYTPEFTSFTGTLQPSKLTNTAVETESVLWENTLTYDREIGKHRFTLLGGYSRQQDRSFTFTGSKLNVPFFGDDSSLYLSNSTTGADVTSTGDKVRYQSYFGRLNYAFDDKYLLSATVRRDGASAYNFDGDQKTATFPSVGLGWIISKEGFMANSGLDFLKLKGSWGRLGNASITRQFDETATTIPGGVAFGTPAIISNATSITQLVDPTIDWEVVTEADFGLELRSLKNRLSVEAGYYNRETKDAVFSVSIPSQAGLGSSFYTNAGTFVNKGFEFDVRWNDKIGDKFTYGIYGNLTTIDNEITEVLGGSFLNTGPGLFGNTIKRWEVGQEIGSYYGFQVAGVAQNAEEAAEFGVPVGGFYFKDQNADGVIDDNDKKFLGSPIPDITYGFGFNLGYANVDFAMEFQGQAGSEIYNFNRNTRFGNENWDQDFVDNHWSPTNPSNSYQAPNTDQQTSRPSSFYVESADYFRIRNITLGYTLPQSFLDRIKIDRLRFYLSAQNPVTSFKYNGFSPELGNQSIENAGIDNNVYPLSAVYSFGLNLNF